jgi:hypothetical protein
MAYKVFFSAIPENRRSAANMVSKFFLLTVRSATTAARVIRSKPEGGGTGWYIPARSEEGGH